MSAFMLGTSAVLAVYRGAQRVWDWTGAALFPRFWSGPLDPTGPRLFQDAAGTTRATAAGQPIGKLVRAAGSIDATQATALSRPTLARWPKGGRRNLLPSTDMTTWTNGGGRVLVTAEPGGWFKLRNTPDQSSVLTFGAFALPSDQRYFGAVLAKAGSAEQATFALEKTGGPTANGGAVVYNLLTGTFTTSAAGDRQGMEDLGGGVWLCWWSGVKSADYANIGFNIFVGRYGSSPAQSEVLLAMPQLEAGEERTAFQKVLASNNILEEGMPDVWHLWNDGGDSLLAPLPPGAHEVATVNHLGKVDYTTVTGDGTGKNVLFGERVADIFARPGTLSGAERLRLEEYWQQRYGAGYLIPPGMVPGVRRMWQDATATMPAVDAGSPVGLLAFSNSWNLGPQLAANADFASAISPWVIQNPSETHTITHTANGIRYVCPTITPAVALAQAGVLVTGKRYLIEVDVSEYVSGSLKSDSVGGVTFVTGAGKNYLVGVAGGTTLQITRASAPTEMTIRSVKAYEIVEPVAAQPTALSRPALARWPKGGRRNLFSASDTSQAAWSKLSAAATQPAASAPAGAVPVRITPTASDGFPRVQQTVNMSGEVVLSAYGKAESYRYLCLSISLIGSRTFNLATGSIASAAGTGFTDAGVEPAGDGWFRCWVKFSAVTNPVVQFGVSNEANGIWQSWTPNGTGSLLLAGVQIEAGSSLTPFQKVTSPNHITEAGVPDVWHLWNDGGDSLPAVLPAGAWEIAWVTHLGTIGYASVTSDGTTGTDLLRTERMADVAVKRGRFTSYEKAQLETQWGKYKP